MMISDERIEQIISHVSKAMGEKIPLREATPKQIIFFAVKQALSEAEPAIRNDGFEAARKIFCGEPVRLSDMDGCGALFGYKLNGDLITIYIEDDEWWHPKMEFNKIWIPDLHHIVQQLRNQP